MKPITTSGMKKIFAMTLIVINVFILLIHSYDFHMATTQDEKVTIVFFALFNALSLGIAYALLTSEDDKDGKNN
mgnify:CR=1 FL=1